MSNSPEPGFSLVLLMTSDPDGRIRAIEGTLSPDNKAVFPAFPRGWTSPVADGRIGVFRVNGSDQPTAQWSRIEAVETFGIKDAGHMVLVATPSSQLPRVERLKIADPEEFGRRISTPNLGLLMGIVNIGKPQLESSSPPPEPGADDGSANDTDCVDEPDEVDHAEMAFRLCEIFGSCRR